MRPSLEGYLRKWTNVMKGWQNRWFVLDENAGLLSYYTSLDKMMKGVRRGCVRLKCAIIGIDNEEDGNFTITTDSKVFHFQARDSDEREIWVRALENTILRHAPYSHQHQVQPILMLRKHMPHHLLKTHFEDDGVTYESNMKRFDNRIAQADVLLQILIDQTKVVEDRVVAVQDDEVKTRLERILQNYNNMLDSIKLAIVLLQILKSTIDPVTGIGLVTASRSKKLRNASGPRRVDYPNTPQPNAGMSDPAREDATNKIELGSECLESRHYLTEGLSSADNVNVPATMTLIVPPDIVPETSYSSSEDDDDFFDADEEINSPVPKSPVLVTAYMAYEESGSSKTANTLPSTSNKTIKSAIYKNGEIDYDALYEDDSGQSDLSMENHGSVITHLLGQVKIGMDLTKVVLPTFILEKRSLLEMYADYFAHPDIFVSIAERSTPRDRMVQVVKWYVSAYHAGRKSSVAKKPYNPIIGEIFQCHWDIPGSPPINTEPSGVGPVPWCSKEQLTFIAEQVSHHPPISAFYAESISRKISFNAYIYTKSKFLGLSIGVHNIGFGTVSDLVHGEDYVVTFPSGYGRSILTTPWIELGGSVAITCKKTGYHANIEFHTKPFYGGKRNRITCEVFSPTEKKPFLTLAGEWNGLIEAKWPESGRTEVFVDVNKLQVTKKMVRKISEQDVNESRNLWKEVTLGLSINDIELATNAKTTLEQKQRDEAKHRKDAGEAWRTKHFADRNGDWYYNLPLASRTNEDIGR